MEDGDDGVETSESAVMVAYTTRDCCTSFAEYKLPFDCFNTTGSGRSAVGIFDRLRVATRSTVSIVVAP